MRSKSCQMRGLGATHLQNNIKTLEGGQGGGQLTAGGAVRGGHPGLAGSQKPAEADTGFAQADYQNLFSGISKFHILAVLA